SLRDELEHSIQIQTSRKEFHSMGRTVAEAIRDEGKDEGNLEAKQQTLLLQLRRKFGKKVTSAIVANIERTKDLDMLDEWLGNVVDGKTLEEVGVAVRRNVT